MMDDIHSNPPTLQTQRRLGNSQFRAVYLYKFSQHAREFLRESLAVPSRECCAEKVRTVPDEPFQRRVRIRRFGYPSWVPQVFRVVPVTGYFCW